MDEREKTTMVESGEVGFESTGPIAKDSVDDVPVEESAGVIEVSITRLNEEWVEERSLEDGRRERRVRRLSDRKMNVRVPVIWIGIILILGLTMWLRPELFESVAKVAVAMIRARAG